MAKEKRVEKPMDPRTALSADELVKNATALAQYQAWRDDPVTHLVVNILRNELRPTHIHGGVQDKEKVALIDNGRMEAGHYVLDRLLNLDVELTSIRHHVPDDRVIELLMRDGRYTQEEARRIVETYKDTEFQDLEALQQQ